MIHQIASHRTSSQRTMPREPKDRQDGYEDMFDYHTLWHDLFRVHFGGWMASGPPLRNLIREIPKAWSVFDREMSSALHMSVIPGQYMISPDCSALFEDERVLLTMNKDNDLVWIDDWCEYHREQHGSTAVLMYDNCSTEYDLETLLACLEKWFPGKAHVVNWRAMHGSFGKDEHTWDSNFGQYGMLENARWRFLQKARSVLSIDVDEMVMSRDIHEATESSTFGYIEFPGLWVERVEDTPGTVRHRDHKHRQRFTEWPCHMKWCVLPTMMQPTAGWRVHGVDLPKPVISRPFYYAHHRAISNSFYYPRPRVTSLKNLVPFQYPCTTK